MTTTTKQISPYSESIPTATPVDYQENTVLCYQQPPAGVAAGEKNVVSYEALHPVVENAKYVDMGGNRQSVVLSFCPKCHKEHVATRPNTKASGATWLGVVAGVIIFWPLCWLPLAVDDMKQTDHYCQNCNAKVGRVKAFGLK